MFISRIGDYFYLYYKDEDGNRKKVTTKSKSKSAALSFLRSFSIEQKQAKHPSNTFSEFNKEYLLYAESVMTPKSFRTYESALRETIRVLGNITIQSVGVKEIEYLVSTKIKESSVWTARRYLICLAAAFQKACDWNLLIENPFRKVKKPRMPEVLPLFLNQKDFQKLFCLITEPDFREFCYVAILTGMRLGEILNLPWSSINFEDKYIVVQNYGTFYTKNKRSRKIPMNNELFILLVERRRNVRNESEWVFHDSKGIQFKENFISKKFRHYVLLSGINPKIHFHSLRHSFASALVKEGISLYAVQKLLGHRSIKTTEIYCHLSPEQLHREVETGLKAFTLQ